MSDSIGRVFIIRDAVSRSKIAGQILKLPLQREWDVAIKRHVRKRTLAQNARLHLLFSLVAEEVGDTIENVKRGYKVLFLEPVIVRLRRKHASVCECCGQPTKPEHAMNVRIWPETSKMNTDELNRFMTQVEVHAAETFGIVLGDGDGNW